MAKRETCIHMMAQAMCMETGPSGFATGRGEWTALSDEGRAIWLRLAAVAYDAIMGSIVTDPVAPR